MNDSLYSQSELDEIGRFLRQSVQKSVAEMNFARPVDAEKECREEVKRLRKKTRTERGKLDEKDIKELDAAVQGPFAPALRVERKRAIDEALAAESNAPKKVPFGILFLRYCAKRLCDPSTQKTPKSGSFVISSAGLTVLLGQLGIPAVFAPAVIWLATKLRDTGMPAFCDALRQYLSSSD